MSRWREQFGSGYTLPDNDSRAEIKVPLHNVKQLSLTLVGGPIMEDGDGQRMGNSNCVGHLTHKFLYFFKYKNPHKTFCTHAPGQVGCHIYTPGPTLVCRGQPLPETLQPSVQHKQQIGPPLYNPSQRRLHLRGPPNHHTYQRWFYVQSGQHHPVVIAWYIIVQVTA